MRQNWTLLTSVIAQKKIHRLTQSPGRLYPRWEPFGSLKVNMGKWMRRMGRKKRIGTRRPFPSSVVPSAEIGHSHSHKRKRPWPWRKSRANYKPSQLAQLPAAAPLEALSQTPCLSPSIASRISLLLSLHPHFLKLAFNQNPREGFDLRQGSKNTQFICPLIWELSDY